VSEGPRALIERWAEALQARDVATLTALAHPDFEDFYPQSGEVTRGVANLIAILTKYPGGIESLGRDRIIGGEERFISTPMFTILRVEGSGDHFTSVQRARYPDGSTWYIVGVAELRDGLIYRMETFFAPTFEPPAWRSDFVEIRPRPADAAERI
jgi:hypothetical protein